MISTGILLGRVGKKQIKTLKSGGEFTTLSIATFKKYKDAEGKSQEITYWHNVQCFSRLSDIAVKYIEVGDLVYIQGEIQNKKIEEGERKGQYSYCIHANEIKFLPKGIKSDKAPKSNDDYFNEEIPF